MTTGAQPRDVGGALWALAADRARVAAGAVQVLSDDEMLAEGDRIADLVASRAITEAEANSWTWRLWGMSGERPPIDSLPGSDVTIVPFHARHLDGFEPGAFDHERYRHLHDQFAKWHGRAISAIEGDRVLAIAGLERDGAGTRIWMIATEDARRRRFLFHRGALRVLAMLVRECRLGRLECEVATEFIAGRRWVERLGFREIGHVEDRVRFEAWRQPPSRESAGPQVAGLAEMRI